MSAKIIAGAITLVVVGGAVFYFATRASSGDAPAPSPLLARGDTFQAEPAYRVGPADARVVLEEYSDYECPFCARAYLATSTEIKSFVEKRGDIQYEFYDVVGRDHRNATAAALAARCAGNQGSYAAAQAALFTYQAEWSKVREPRPVADVVMAAVSDRGALEACMQRDSAIVVEILVANLRKALANRVAATPTLIVWQNGEATRMTGTVDSARLAAALK